MWHPSLQRITRCSRSKSSSLCYKYNGKPADAGNNKRQHTPRSTSAGRKECYSSMLCISPLNSSMKALSLARTTAEAALAAGHANQTSGPSVHLRVFIFFLSLPRKNKLYPEKINLCGQNAAFTFMHGQLLNSTGGAAASHSAVIKCWTRG